jgi:adenosylcobinamide-GDP ribazoletransferase
VANLLPVVNYLVQVPSEFILKLVPAAMTVAFLLVVTGLQHFDGLVDLGNAIGLGSVEQRRAAAHAWIVTYKGAVLAIIVELVAFSGLFFLSGETAFRVIVAAEVAAKLAMVTILAVGKPTHKGLGGYFLEKGKRKRNIVGYLLSVLIVIPLLGLLGLLIVLVGVVSGVIMERVALRVFGGVSGDMIGATNEITRAAVLALAVSVMLL